MNPCLQVNGKSIDIGQEIKINDQWHIVSTLLEDKIKALRISDGTISTINANLVSQYETNERPPQRISYKLEHYRLGAKNIPYRYKPFSMGDIVYFLDISDESNLISRAVIKSGVFVDDQLKYINLVEPNNPLEVKRVNPKLVWSYAL